MSDFKDLKLNEWWKQECEADWMASGQNYPDEPMNVDFCNVDLRRLLAILVHRPDLGSELMRLDPDRVRFGEETKKALAGFAAGHALTAILSRCREPELARRVEWSRSFPLNLTDPKAEIQRIIRSMGGGA